MDLYVCHLIFIILLYIFCESIKYVAYNNIFVLHNACVKFG